MVKSSCVLSPKSMEELDGIAKNNDIVLFLHSRNCGHCKKTLPVLEEECRKNDSAGVKFVECPIEMEHCRTVAQAAKVSGVPDTSGIKKGDNITNRVFHTVGARIPELVGNIQSFVSDGKKSGGARPMPQPPQQGAPPPRQMPAPAPRISLDNAFLRVMGSAPSVPYGGGGNTVQFGAPNPQYVEMCVPGKTCSKDEFEQKFVDFYNTDYEF